MSGIAVLSGARRVRRRQFPGSWGIVIAAITVVASLLAVSPGSAGASGSKAADLTATSGDTPAQWSIERTPSLNVEDAYLSGVSCPNPTTCFAVGEVLNQRAENVVGVQEWNGRSWSMLKAPSPRDSVASALNAVSCASAKLCVGVGYYTHSPAGNPLAETWNGSAWKASALPDSSGEMDGVSCASTRFCLAVGYSFQGEGVALADRWDGSKWTKVSIPTPNGAIFVQASAVSCESPEECEVVGSYLATSGSSALFGERWNGKSFKLQTLSAPPFANYFQLVGVSCKTDVCLAVGFSDSDQSSGVNLLAELWNGAKWTIIRTPSGGSAELSGVSCSTRTRCTAVGNQFDGSTQHTFAMGWNGLSLSIEQTPNPAGSSSLGAVSCDSPDRCIATGSVVTGANPFANIAEDWDGRSWSLQSISSPLGYSGGSLGAVSCSAASSCVAVGGNDNLSPVSEIWNGSSWNIEPLPGAVTGQAALSGVSCVSSTDCIAVGYLFSAQGIAVQWNGKRWERLPVPVGADLTSVSCTSGSACVAVGFAENNENPGPTVISESWNGVTWTESSPVQPTGSRQSQFVAVSCARANYCEAVGNWYGASGGELPLVESWNGKLWRIQASASFPDELPSLYAVSCPEVSSCIAIGTDTDRLQSSSAFSEIWNGKRWTTLKMPSPTGGAELSGIDCSTANSCVTVGGDAQGALVESWNGTAWSIEHAAMPFESGDTGYLNGVSCTSSCTAVGYYTENQELGATLAERN